MKCCDADNAAGGHIEGLWVFVRAGDKAEVWAFLFSGLLDSGSLKIQYSRNRYYDQYAGRWTTHDPLGITPNSRTPNKFDVTGQCVSRLGLYEYTGGRCTSHSDAFGLYSHVGGYPPAGLFVRLLGAPCKNTCVPGYWEYEVVNGFPLPWGRDPEAFDNWDAYMRWGVVLDVINNNVLWFLDDWVKNSIVRKLRRVNSAGWTPWLKVQEYRCECKACRLFWRKCGIVKKKPYYHKCVGYKGAIPSSAENDMYDLTSAVDALESCRRDLYNKWWEASKAWRGK